MKIAIFGDSFAHTNPLSKLKDKAWYNLLKSQGHSVTLFSSTGSSLWYSYDKFIKNHAVFDRCIIMVTNWGRFHLPQLKQPFWPGVSQIEEFLKVREFPEYDRNVLISTYNWAIYARNDDQEIAYHQLMLQDIVLKRPDALIIPCFDYDLSRVPTGENCTLFDVSMIDILYYRIDWQDDKGIWRRRPLRKGGLELRACHMNDANNKILADKIENWLLTNQFYMKKEDFVQPIESVDYYFELDFTEKT